MRQTVIFAGESGQGIDRTALIFGKIIAKLGYSCFIYRDYSSLIRGGHNFSVVTFSNKKTQSHDNIAHAIVAFNQKSADIHKNNLHKGGVIFTREDINSKSNDIYVINNALLGMISKYFSIPKEIGISIIKKEFTNQSNEAIKAYISGFLKNISISNFKAKKIGKPLNVFDGNKAVAEGAIDAGVKVVFYYPMTPATGIFSHLEKIKKTNYPIVEQMEDEISVANAILGASYAGVKVMTGSSGGGMALMSEAISFAGMAELPSVFYLAQRAGPSTGVPTYTGQGDLKFALHIGQGEFPKIVLIPGDLEDSYRATREAFYFSSKYRMPALIISDKHIAESHATFNLLKVHLPKIESLNSSAKIGYKSYEITDSGISPSIMPGGKQIFRVTSYEHDEYGHTTEDPILIKLMNNKRTRKEQTLKNELMNFPGVSLFGKGNKFIVFAGSPKGAVLDALPRLKGYKAIQINRLHPFPTKEFMKIIKKQSFYIVENNTTSQLASIIKEATSINPIKNLLRYDGRPFTSEDIINFFNEIT